MSNEAEHSPLADEPTNENMSVDKSSNLHIDGCFEVRLARDLAINKEPLQIQEAISRWGKRLSLLSSDKHLKLAAALHWEFRRRLCRVKHDETSLQTLHQKYKQVRDFVTPIYHLPSEILTEVFFIDIDLEDRQSPIRLMLVCRDWYLAVEGMARLWKSLKLGTWTALDRAERVLQRVWWLNVVIHTEEDMGKEGNNNKAYEALNLVVNSASRWRRLTIDSLPLAQSGDVDRPVLSLGGTSPIKELRCLKVASQAESSPLLTQILENIGTAAVGSLSTMETTSCYIIRHLIQPEYAPLFHSLTTLKVDFRNAGNSIDLLPYLERVEVLDLANVSLLPYADDINLPLTHSLRHLRLAAVSMQWMGGRIFPELRSCSLTSPTHSLPLLSDVDFPVCTELELRNWDVKVARRFRTPIIHSLAIKSNKWTPVSGSKQVIIACSAGLGVQLRPRLLHLAALCKESVLLSVLELLPALEELRLDLPRSSVLGRWFFMSLLAKPADNLNNDIERGWDEEPKSREDRMSRQYWKSSICPSLRRLELKYERWPRRTDQLDILPSLMALHWSREATVTPLQSVRLCFRASNAQWKVFPLDAMMINPHHVEELAHNIPELRPFQDSQKFSCLELFLVATATPVMDADFSWGLKMDVNHMMQDALPVFESSFRHLSTLRIRYGDPELHSTFDLLPNFFRLEELELDSVNIPSYSINVDLPLVRTLLRLSLRSTTISWMSGRIFPRLKRFCLREDRFGTPFSGIASLPVCTHIRFYGFDCHLPQSSFHVPILDELELLLGPPRLLISLRQSDLRQSSNKGPLANLICGVMPQSQTS